MLLYNACSERELAFINYINQGLREKQLCVYASVDAYNTSHISKISRQIKEYEENVIKRNLIILNLKPFYDSALAGDLTPFDEFYIQLQQELKHRDDKNGVLIVADCADNLFRDKHFDQCDKVEKWWQDVYLKWLQQQEKTRGKDRNHIINVICPHSGSLLSRHPFDKRKHQLSHNHSIIMDAAGYITTRYVGSVAESSSCVSSVAPIRILVVEPEPDHQQVYSIWLRSMGFKEIVITNSGNKCLDEILNRDLNKDKTVGFDIIILDTHLRDIPFVEVATKIANAKPDQQFIFTSTLPSDIIKQDIDSIGIKNNKGILTKPFGFVDLSSVIDRNIRNQ
ncbi:MAG TPA: response regulator [Candidatus Bathyarchaeia archaeon]|nr:response regulator [Candidatus Bathyarchaeia archaeon]